jgi:succinate-acetate transporter protein
MRSFRNPPVALAALCLAAVLIHAAAGWLGLLVAGVALYLAKRGVFGRPSPSLMRPQRLRAARR